jgi:hypothetical protein
MAPSAVAGGAGLLRWQHGLSEHVVVSWSVLGADSDCVEASVVCCQELSRDLGGSCAV